MKCILCNNIATKYTVTNESINPVYLCETHYRICKYKETLSPELCVLCKTIKGAIVHHTQYFPERKIILCHSCHRKVHGLNKSDLKPPNGHADLFYKIKRAYKNDSVNLKRIMEELTLILNL